MGRSGPTPSTFRRASWLSLATDQAGEAQEEHLQLQRNTTAAECEPTGRLPESPSYLTVSGRRAGKVQRRGALEWLLEFLALD